VIFGEDRQPGADAGSGSRRLLAVYDRESKKEVGSTNPRAELLLVKLGKSD
jgi:hypothetical protein